MAGATQKTRGYLPKQRIISPSLGRCVHRRSTSRLKSPALIECKHAIECSQIVVSSVEELDLFHEQAIGVPLLMRIWVEFTTNDYIGAPQPDVHFEGLVISLKLKHTRYLSFWLIRFIM